MDHESVAFSGTPRYTPTRLLGVGGMGAVYEAEDRTTGARVALKVMATNDPSRLLRFKNEFRVMAELYHPNLVRLFDLGTHEGQWFFTMELVDGSDLLQVLLDEEAPALRTSSEDSLEVTTADARPSEAEAGARAAEDAPASAPNARTHGQPASDAEAVVRVVAQILDALEFLHAQGIVHRDLKPANILVDVDGVVRLLDFGLASRGDRELRISQEGALVGTLAYLSPEQLRGEPASPASDLYALGCMLFQLLTGSLPFPGTLVQALLVRTEAPPPKIDERVLGVPEPLVEVVHRLMARDPADRPTIGEVRAELGIGPRARSARVRDRPASITSTGELFVGRQRELAVVAGCLERAAGGQPEVVVVSGPSGIGKSAFASMVTRRAARLGFSCFAGRCYEREHLAFVAFDRVMDAVALTLRGRDDDALAALRAPLLELERIFPALGLVTARWTDERPRDPDTADPRALHERAFEALRTLVAALEAEAPLCFVLDDLQWADEESLALLQRLLELRQGRILVVALALPQALSPGTGLHAVVRASARHEATTTIALGALHAGDAVHLAEAVTGRRLAPATSAALVDQAEGNPFLVRMLAEHIAALPTADRADQLQGAASTEDLLREMMGALSPRADQVLALAAAAGGDVAMALLRDASALPGEELDVAVGELLASRLVKIVRLSSGDDTPRIDLYQERIREVAYRRLDAPARRAAHLALALALERAHATRGEAAIRRGSDAEALVHHFTEAGDRDKRRRYAVEAAERAAQKLAFLRAARLFRIVLDDPEPGEDPLVTAARWERAGDLFDYGGHHLEAARAYEQAVRRWDEAPEAHPERGAARLRLLGLIGAHLLATHDLAEGRAAFRRGLELVSLPFDRPVPARVAVLASLKLEAVAAERLGFVRTPRADPRASTEVRFFDHLVRGVQPLWPWLAAEAALRAELASRRADDKVVLTRSMLGSAVVPVLLGRCSPGQIQRAHERLDAADELARAHDVPLGPELVQLHRALLWLTTNAARARRSADDALEGFGRHGMLDSFDGAVARVFHGLVLVQTGDDETLLTNAARELDRRHGNFINVALAFAVQVNALTRRGALVEAREPLAKLDAHLARTPPSRLGFIRDAAKAAVLVAEGCFQEALASADAAEADARRTGAWAVGFERTRFHAVMLEAALGLARRGRLDARARAKAEARAEWLVARGVFDWGCLGHRARALLAHASGKRREAARALREALHQSSVNTGPHHRWRCVEAARDLGSMTREQELEAAELAEAGKYAKPVGWNG